MTDQRPYPGVPGVQQEQLKPCELEISRIGAGDSLSISKEVVASHDRDFEGAILEALKSYVSI